MAMTTTLGNEDVLHLLAGRTPRNMDRLLAHFLARAGVPLSKEQWSVMAVLWKDDGRSQQAIADATDRDRPGTTRLIDGLEREGYVQRRPHPTDRRSNLVHLTRKGRAMERKVAAALNDAVDVATEGISPRQISMLRNLFAKIDSNIQALKIGE